MLTHQKLYITDKREQVYSVVSGAGANRSRRAYCIAVRGDLCAIFDGRFEMLLPLAMLIQSVRALCGIGEGAIPSLELVEETLRAANC